MDFERVLTHFKGLRVPIRKLEAIPDALRAICDLKNNELRKFLLFFTKRSILAPDW